MISPHGFARSCLRLDTKSGSPQDLGTTCSPKLEEAWTMPMPIEELEVDSYLLLIFNGDFILGPELGINTAPIVNLGKGSRRACHVPRWLFRWRQLLGQRGFLNPVVHRPRPPRAPACGGYMYCISSGIRRLILGCCLLLLPPALPMGLPARQRRRPPCSSLPFCRRTRGRTFPQAPWWREVVGTIHAPKMRTCRPNSARA
jgi:hypothetical protein